MDQEFKLNAEATQLLQFAEKEARAQRVNYIGTEHLVLAMVRYEQAASRILMACGIDQTQVVGFLEQYLGTGDHEAPATIGLTPRSIAVMTLATDEARKLGHEEVGAEHILLGLLREGVGMGANALEYVGMTLELARQAVLTVSEAAVKPRTCILCRREEGSDSNIDLQLLYKVAFERKWPTQNLQRGYLCRYCRADDRLNILSVLYGSG